MCYWWINQCSSHTMLGNGICFCHRMCFSGKNFWSKHCTSTDDANIDTSEHDWSLPHQGETFELRMSSIYAYDINLFRAKFLGAGDATQLKWLLPGAKWFCNICSWGSWEFLEGQQTITVVQGAPHTPRWALPMCKLEGWNTHCCLHFPWKQNCSWAKFA